MADEVPRWWRIAPLHREMGYVGGALFSSGAVLVLIDLATPPQDYAARGWVVAVMVSAFLAGAFYLWSAEHLPMPIWGYAIGTSGGAVMVTVLVLFILAVLFRIERHMMRRGTHKGQTGR